MQAPAIEPVPPIPPIPPIPPTPALPQEPAVPAPPRTITAGQVGGSPQATYQALRAKREVLGEYMSRLLNRRENVADRLNQPNVTPAEKAALEEHLKELNARIIDMEKQLHQSDAEVAAAAGVPGAATREPQTINFPNIGPSEDVYIAGVVFAGTACLIVAFAYARRLWKGAAKVVTQFPPALEARFTRFEQAIDTMAIEIERVSEGQRFLTKILGEQGQRGIGAGPAQPIETRAGVADPIRRS
jgi:hypothetical protein